MNSNRANAVARLVKSYFPTKSEFDREYFDKSELHRYNVAFHTLDKDWLTKYILNLAYMEFRSSCIVYEIHDFLASNHFDDLVKKFQYDFIAYKMGSAIKDCKANKQKNVQLAIAETKKELISKYNFKESVVNEWLFVYVGNNPLLSGDETTK